METIKRYFRIHRKEIAFLRFVFEAYDGIATVTTIDPAKGLVALCIAPGCEPVVATVVEGLQAEMLIAPAPGPQDRCETGRETGMPPDTVISRGRNKEDG